MLVEVKKGFGEDDAYVVVAFNNFVELNRIEARWEDL